MEQESKMMRRIALKALLVVAGFFTVLTGYGQVDAYHAGAITKYNTFANLGKALNPGSNTSLQAGDVLKITGDVHETLGTGIVITTASGSGLASGSTIYIQSASDTQQKVYLQPSAYHGYHGGTILINSMEVRIDGINVEITNVNFKGVALSGGSTFSWDASMFDVTNATLTLKRCLLRNNQITNQSSYADRGTNGAAIHASSNSVIDIDADTQISDCHTTEQRCFQPGGTQYNNGLGGAICAEGNAVVNMRGTISGCKAGLGGGAIHAAGNSTLNVYGTITGCETLGKTFYGAFNAVGGAISMENHATVNIYGTITNCTTVTYGGAIGMFGITPLHTGYSANGFPTLAANLYLKSGCSISNCTGTHGGVSSQPYAAGGAVFCDFLGSVVMEDGATISNFTESNYFTVGVGICNHGTLNMTGGTIESCVSRSGSNGAAIYNDGTATVGGNSIIQNCTVNGGAGGAIFNTGTDATVTIKDNALIKGNTATGLGGGIYNSGTLYVQGGKLEGNVCPDGGAINNAKTCTITSGEICNNVNSSIAAGIKNTGTLTISGTAKITGNKSTGDGAAIHNSGTLTIQGGEISSNASTGAAGGAIFNAGGTATITNGSIHDNIATTYGGAIYNSATLNIQGGSITSNISTNNGGGINNAGTLNLSNGTISGNSSTSGNGDGIYQNGTMNLSGSPVFGTNDVYLPCNKTLDNGSGTNRVITKNGTISMTDGSLHVTLGNNASNLYTGRNILETGTVSGSTVVKDDLKIFTLDNQSQLDSKLLIVLYTASDATTHNAVLELSGHPTWVTAVTSQPSDFLHGGVPYIDSKEDLAWLISYVTGYNGATPQSLSGKTIILAADLDMDEHIWVPIGSKSHPFEGTFNGNGRIIKGLRNVGKTTEEAGFDYPLNIVAGMFGYVSGTIKNTFIEDCNFEAKKNGGYYGIIADTITGSAIVHSSEVMGTLAATNASAHIGGLVGWAKSGEVHSAISFATLTGTTDRGGIVNKIDEAILRNSFCKFNSFDTGKELCATNSNGTIDNCYYVQGSTRKMSDGTAFTTPGTRPYLYGVVGSMAGSDRMIDKMNRWVASNGATKYAQWAQPITDGINADDPVLKLADFNSMASKSGSFYLYYNADLDTQLADVNMATIFFYGIKERSTQSYSGNGLYIDQDAALTGTGTVNAHTSRLLDNSGADYWHLYSSPLADAPLGFSYGQSAGYLPEVADPCNVSISGGNVLPSNTPTGKFDFYAFYEPQYHWVNFKRKSDSHWHMDGEHANIAYTNETTLTPGKGYLVALEDLSYLQSAGTLNKGNVTINVTADAGNELKGYNLIGNPYQSYLSFAGFAEVNPNLWSGTPSFAVYDAETDTYIPGSASTPSSGSYASTGDINVHQGFFIVKTGSATTATFNESMRSVKPADGTHFRGERPAFPLINLKATSADGTGDIAVVEFGRPDSEGAAKMKNIGGNGKVYFRYGDEDYAVLYMDREVEQLPLYFETTENATYTLTWNTANATFNQLHLIDNLTGLDIDMLSSEGYSFTAKPGDYKSRFRLVFEYNGIDEDSYVEPAETFAFFSNGNLIVNGEGHLEVIDMQGRVLKSTSLTDTQNTLSLPEAAHGIYMLKLTSNNNVRIQKIIVR